MRPKTRLLFLVAGLVVSRRRRMRLLLLVVAVVVLVLIWVRLA